MIRLTMPRDPVTIHMPDLPFALWMRLRPPSSALIEAAKAKAYAAGKALAEQVTAVRNAGGDVGGLLDLSDPDIMQGQAITGYAACLAQLALLDWGGAAVEDPDTGMVVPPSPNIIAELMRWPGLPDRFISLYLAPLNGAVSEGNASGAASPGPSGAAPIIAVDAEKKDCPVPMGA